MKKLTALLLASLFAFACAAPSRAYAAQWADAELSDFREVWYVDYGDTVANDINGNTPMGSDNSRASSGGETKWMIETCFIAGFEVGALLGNDSLRNVVPVDLDVEENTVYIYAIVTRKVVVGLLYAKVNVDEGTLTIEGQVKGGNVYFNGETLLMIYPSVSSLSEAGLLCEAGTPVSIREELSGAKAVLLELNGYVTYSAVVATDAQSGAEVRRFALQDYWKNENRWKNYRARMQDALLKVPE